MSSIKNLNNKITLLERKIKYGENGGINVDGGALSVNPLNNQVTINPFPLVTQDYDSGVLFVPGNLNRSASIGIGAGNNLSFGWGDIPRIRTTRGDNKGLNIEISGASMDMYYTDTRFSVQGEKMRILSTGNVGIGTTAPTSTLDLSGNFVRVRNTTTPASSADTIGNIGDIAWDANYVYVKTAAGWKRSGLTAF
jgi:hypothetical protein